VAEAAKQAAAEMRRDHICGGQGVTSVHQRPPPAYSGHPGAAASGRIRIVMNNRWQLAFILLCDARRGDLIKTN